MHVVQTRLPESDRQVPKGPWREGRTLADARQTKTGVGLVVLYGAAALSRQALEPRLVGKQVGLNPVLTLLALYTGYRLLGIVGGMIVFPITAMLLKQIWDHSGLQPEG
ncbi:MAG: AI-2E family transporter [Oscillospiraceae bacterium]